MPFRSESQRRFLWANHPEIARRWTNEYGSKPVAGQIPPQFLKGKGGNPQQDQAKQAGTDAAKRRLEMLRKKHKKQPEGK